MEIQRSHVILLIWGTTIIFKVFILPINERLSRLSLLVKSLFVSSSVSCLTFYFDAHLVSRSRSFTSCPHPACVTTCPVQMCCICVSFSPLPVEHLVCLFSPLCTSSSCFLMSISALISIFLVSF